ncbi:MAG: PqiB family protein [Burkholderiales bacterium]
MADDTDFDHLPEATVVPRKSTRISAVWIVPIVAAIVGVGIAIQSILSEGPTITVVFKSAEGIEADKTFIKYKDVNIGQVTAVQLSEDYAKVDVRAKIAKSAAGLMVEDAEFWIVRPRITLSGISGLSTLLSGNYIGFEAGKSDKTQRSFTGLEVPPVVTGGAPGRQFALKADDLGSLGIGSPIYYRRLQVGQVIAYDLAPDGKAVDVKVFINEPYDKYVSPGTRFWNASGLDVSVGANGVDVRTASLVTLLVGGLAFDTPAFLAQAEPAAENTIFTLYSDRATAMKQPDSIARHYVLYFTESLQGLAVGAPVTFLGLAAGEVTDVGLTYDAATLDIRPRVDITLYPERLLARLRSAKEAGAKTLDLNVEKRNAVLRSLVEERGMRAQLRSTSLLTGQMYVALDYFPRAPKTKIDLTLDTPELPVVPSTLPDMQAKLTSILAKLDKLPLEAIGAGLKKDLEILDQTLNDANKVLSHVDAEIVPELKTTLEDARHALAAAERVMNGTETNLVGTNAPAQQELRDALLEVTRAARALRILADYLGRHPEALIRGKAEQKGGSK